MPLNDSNAPVPGLNAHRYPQKPLRQPGYLFEDVPKCAKDFNGSVIQKVTNRDHFKEAMGEMVLLCIEAMRRNNTTKTASKPLSLEYIADRVDVDDPCFGYLIRTNQGHLQAFVTITTFTNWQKSFRWDSLHELAFFYDDDHHDHSGSSSSGSDSESDSEQQKQLQQRRQQRKADADGTLAKQLQSTVRLGDPHNEGIVWPRIAEISLLGSLGGCGRKLVELVLEDLDYQKATGSANYDYVVLQATDNSIPFYESLGFIRVGAVSDDPNSRRGQAAPPPEEASPVAAAPPKKQPRFKSDSSSSSPSSSSTDTVTTPSRRRQHHLKSQLKKQPASSSRSPSPALTTNSSVDSDGGCVAKAVPLDDSSPLKPDALALPSVDIVSSPLIVYEVAKGGERPDQIAKKNKVNVWDIIFLNKEIYKEITPSSKLKKGTILHIPAPSSSSLEKQEEERKPTKWFIAKENDTPRKIAKMYSIPCKDLVAGNLSRLPELQAASRLKAGTRVKVSNLHIEEDKSQPYCHWSFPDDDVAENGEPSYMMAYKLNRGGRKNNPPRPVLKSLAVPISPYTPPQLLMPSEAAKSPPLTRARQYTKDQKDAARPTSTTKRKKVAGPKPPKLPPSGLDIFRDQQRELCPQLREKTPQNFKVLTQRWFELSEDKRSRYNNIAKESKKRYDQEMEEYEVAHSLWEEEREKVAVKQVDTGLFSKVVKLREDALSGKEYTYWFVLTYIPDLKWCHLAPMVRDGVFGPERKKSQGRPKWKLVEEELGKELDISSFFCIPVKSRAMKRTADADKEEWDILDEDNATSFKPGDALKSSDIIVDHVPASRGPIRKQPMIARSAIKPLESKGSVRKKKRPAPSSNSSDDSNDNPPKSPPPKKTRTNPTTPRTPPRSPAKPQGSQKHNPKKLTSPSKPLHRSSPRLKSVQWSSETFHKLDSIHGTIGPTRERRLCMY